MLEKTLSKIGQWALSRAAGEGGIFVPKSMGGVSVPKSYPWNWWQKDLPVDPQDVGRFGPVLTCVSIIAQDISRIPLQHVRVGENDAREKIVDRAPARLFRKPNPYQTIVDFLLYLGRSLLFDGNFYAYASRNERGEISALYPLHPRAVSVYLDPQGSDYFYLISSDNTTQMAGVESQVWLQPHQVFHVRLFTPVHPLVGESPLVAGLIPASSGMSINRHSASFFKNMVRPSGVLKHPKRLQPEAMTAIKKRWMQLFSGDNIGEPAVLSEGMEWQQVQMNAVDAELIKSYSLSERQIFQIFRVPPFLGGDMDQSSLNNVESLIRFYLQSCLGFYVKHIETALTAFFRLRPDESIVFDLEKALLRGDFEQRMTALGKAVQNGVYSTNEARARENLPPVEYGDEPRMQQQMVPLSFGVLNPQTPNPGSAATPPGDEGEESEDEVGETSEERGLRLSDETAHCYRALKEMIDGDD